MKERDRDEPGYKARPRSLKDGALIEASGLNPLMAFSPFV
jgi:hypothetical protein